MKRGASEEGREEGREERLMINEISNDLYIAVSSAVPVVFSRIIQSSRAPSQGSFARARLASGG